MLFLLIFGAFMTVLIVKALFETAYAAVIMIWAMSLLALGYTLKGIAFVLEIFENLQERNQTKKVCHA